MKVKDLGQVFTPKAIVNDILQISNYYGENILKKHVMENSCGNGAFLTEIIDRYINEYYKKHHTYEGVKKELEKYIHGIECDTEIYHECINNLKAKCEEYHIENVEFDIRNEDALKVEKFNNKMDFVLGNPPYVRVHNLDKQYDAVKKYSFCESGMTDLYIVFYEIGINMLKKHGTLCYITPNSFYNSVAGNKLREYIKKKKNMEVLMDLGHYQPFAVNTYTTICKICKNSRYKECQYFKYDSKTGKPEFVTNIPYKSLFIDNTIVLSSNSKRYFKYLNYDLKKNLKVEVKNGFATLNDDIFIQNEFDFQNNVIDVIKASTGQWKKCIYPYDEEGKVIPFDQLDTKVQQYFKENKTNLIKEDTKTDSDWYAFGRTQAINDVKLNKIAINTCVKDVDSIKINPVDANQGVYSGLYMVTEKPYEEIREKICSEEFIEYLKIVNKCKSGGYYTFSSKDLAKYINCRMEGEKMNNTEFLKNVEKSFRRYLETGSRSNQKLKILHGAIASDLSSRLDPEYNVHSLGYGDDKEAGMAGKYMNKKVDIAIEKDDEVIGAIALKFIMRNYSQNSNNYFENMLGETANIRAAGKPYFQIFIVPSKVPYFNKSGKITHIEKITTHNLEKYIQLSNENIDDCLHVPNKTLFYLIDIPELPEYVKDNEQYTEFYQNMKDFKVTENNGTYGFGDAIILNDYNTFMEDVVHSIMEK